MVPHTLSEAITPCCTLPEDEDARAHDDADMAIDTADRESQSSLGPSMSNPRLHPGASNVRPCPTAFLCGGGASTTHSPTHMSARVSLGAPIFASRPTLQCLEFHSCGSFSRPSKLDADSAFGGGRRAYGMMWQDGAGEASTYAKRCRRGPRPGTMWRCDAMRQRQVHIQGTAEKAADWARQGAMLRCNRRPAHRQAHIHGSAERVPRPGTMGAAAQHDKRRAHMQGAAKKAPD